MHSMVLAFGCLGRCWLALLGDDGALCSLVNASVTPELRSLMEVVNMSHFACPSGGRDVALGGPCLRSLIDTHASNPLIGLGPAFHIRYPFHIRCSFSVVARRSLSDVVVCLNVGGCVAHHQRVSHIETAPRSQVFGPFPLGYLRVSVCVAHVSYVG